MSKNDEYVKSLHDCHTVDDPGYLCLKWSGRSPYEICKDALEYIKKQTPEGLAVHHIASSALHDAEIKSALNSELGGQSYSLDKDQINKDMIRSFEGFIKRESSPE